MNALARLRPTLWAASLAVVAGAALTLILLLAWAPALVSASGVVRLRGLDALALVLLGGGVTGMAIHTRRNDRELRDAVQGLEIQTIVLEQQGESLNRRQREIRALNEDLEVRVALRTAELGLANQKLEAANGARSEFIANMSHEIRTPMTAVLGYADLLVDPDLSGADRLGFVQTIRRNGEHLLSILNDILDISKIDAGKMTVERIGCAPIQIVAEVASLMRVRALEKGLTFAVAYETAVPAQIESDPTRLRQILLNLVGNAIKFTSKGAVRLLVRSRDDGPHTRLAFEVADTGIGLSKGQIDKLFQPFAQADASTTRQFGGTGLGLVICQRLARMLNGSIEVESLAGRGSSFTFALDATCPAGTARIAALQEAGTRAPDPSPSAAIPAIHGSVLLAEDGPDNQVLIASHLRKAGATVAIADNGRIAVDKALAAAASGKPFDVILMDMQMPELDGYGATSALRSAGYRGAIIALTAHAMAGDDEKCRRAGCDDYLTKPIQRGVLLGAVRRHLGLRAA